MGRLMTVFAAATALAAAGCTTAGSGATIADRIAASSADRCPPGDDERPYTISVSNRAADTVALAVRQRIANAIASEWSEVDHEHEEPRPAALFRTLREMSAYVPKPARYGLGRWRVQPDDSATAVLSYQRGRPPRIVVAPDARRELRDRIIRVVTSAIATAANDQAIRDTMPLQIPGSGSDPVSLGLRFGWTPPPGAAVATFALRDREPTPRGRAVLSYPDEYRRANIEGSVLVAFIMTDSGTVDARTVRVISSDGGPFTRNVLEYLRRARYHPFMIDCVALPLVTAQPFNFRLVRQLRGE